MKRDYGLTMRGIIKNDKGEILVLKRHPKSRTDPDTWELPGGKVENGEFFDDALVREIKEETNLEVELLRNFRVSEQYDPVEKPGVTKQVVYFLAEYSDETPIVVRPDEVRSLKSLSFEEALDILEHNNMKEILKQADEHIKTVCSSMRDSEENYEKHMIMR